MLITCTLSSGEFKFSTGAVKIISILYNYK